MQLVSKWLILFGAFVSLASGCKSDPPAPKVTADSAKLKATAAPSASASTSATTAALPYGPDDLLADIEKCADSWLNNVLNSSERCEKALALWSEGGVEAAVAKYKAGCDGGDGKACTLLIGAHGHPKSPMQSKNLGVYMEDVVGLQIKACGLGEPNACVAIVDWHSCNPEGASAYVPPHCPTRVIAWLNGKKNEDFPAILEPGCKKGHAKSCTNRGYYLKLVKGQVDEVTDHYKKGCELGDPKGCWEAERIAKVFGDEAERRALKSKEFALQERECRRFRDCSDIAGDYQNGFHLPEHLPKVRELLTFYCEKKALDDSDCIELAVMQVKGDGAPADAAAGLARLNAVCDKKPFTSEHDAAWIDLTAKGCRTLAGLYRNGTGVQKDKAKAKAILKKVCVKRDPSSTWIDRACRDLDELGK
jgi:TPR repeat protein